MTVLVLTHPFDLTADLVVRELSQRQVPVVRCDLAEFPERITQTARIGPTSNSWSGGLGTDRRCVSLAEIRSVWYRKPSPIGVPSEASAAEQQWAAAEATSGLGGLLSALNVHWVNHPENNAAANDRPRQLAMAAQCGLTVPDSLLTNDADSARSFCHEHRHTGVLYKPLTGAPTGRLPDGRPAVLLANTVTADEITADIACTSHLLQARVPCSYSVRLVVVGERMFATRIDAPADVVDWRSAHDQLTMQHVSIPNEVVSGMQRLMQAFGLTFASSDWIVTPEGTWTYIGDLNPNGQWAWLEPVYHDITNALASNLSKESDAPHDDIATTVGRRPRGSTCSGEFTMETGVP